MLLSQEHDVATVPQLRDRGVGVRPHGAGRLQHTVTL